MDSFTKYEHIQIEEVCRICLLKKDEMSLIYKSSLADMLLECASVQVTPENGLFNLVCNQCQNEVSRWHVFKQQVVRSFEIGKWLLNRKPKSLNIYSVKLDVDVGVEKEKTNTSNERNFERSTFSSHPSTIIKNVERLKGLLDEESGATNKDQIQITENCFETNNQTVPDENPFVCCWCDKPFKTLQVLIDHMKRVHYNTRRYHCELCNRKFYSIPNLNDHLKSHKGEKPFKCKVCGWCFGTKAILRQHLSVHTIREKKYQCHIYNKFLLTPGSLETHVKKHSGVKPFSCSGCEKRFFTKEAMQRYFSAIHDTDIHTHPYNCEI